MTMIELQVRFPEHKFKQELLETCPCCKGTGLRSDQRPCICSCLSEPDSKLRLLAVTALLRVMPTLAPAFKHGLN